MKLSQRISASWLSLLSRYCFNCFWTACPDDNKTKLTHTGTAMGSPLSLSCSTFPNCPPQQQTPSVSHSRVGFSRTHKANWQYGCSGADSRGLASRFGAQVPGEAGAAAGANWKQHTRITIYQLCSLPPTSPSPSSVLHSWSVQFFWACQGFKVRTLLDHGPHWSILSIALFFTLCQCPSIPPPLALFNCSSALVALQFCQGSRALCVLKRFLLL